MRKSGEMTTQQIVILIVAIVSFAVILFLMFRLNLGGTTDEELCHNSVIMRGSAVVPSDALPLKCSRKYICINNGGDCKGLTNPEIKEVKSLNETYKVLAEEMADCWWMFGEGRVNYVGTDFVSNNYCSICSQIYFDESLESITGNEISKSDLFDYLEKNKIDNTNNYLQYLFGVDKKEKVDTKLEEKGAKNYLGNIELDKQYFVLMSIASKTGHQWTILKGAGVVVAGASFFTPAGWITAAVFVAGVGTTGAGIVGEEIYSDESAEILGFEVSGRGIDNKFMAPTIIEANSEKFEALNCEEILTLA